MALSQARINTLIDTMSDDQMRYALRWIAAHDTRKAEMAIDHAIIEYPLIANMVVIDETDKA